MLTTASIRRGCIFGFEVIAVLGALVLGCQPSETASETSREPSTSAISYRTAAKWQIPNGGYGQAIVIPSQYCNETDMRRLGQQLKRETSAQRNAFVFIYDDSRAASLRQGALTESISKDEMAFHDRHMVGSYMRNANTGFHQLEISLQGLNGPYVTVGY